MCNVYFFLLFLTQFIRLTASAINQSTTQKMVDKYAAMIMKELDPDDFGHIMVN